MFTVIVTDRRAERLVLEQPTLQIIYWYELGQRQPLPTQWTFRLFTDSVRSECQLDSNRATTVPFRVPILRYNSNRINARIQLPCWQFALLNRACSFFPLAKPQGWMPRKELCNYPLRPVLSLAMTNRQKAGGV